MDDLHRRDCGIVQSSFGLQAWGQVEAGDWQRSGRPWAEGPSAFLRLAKFIIDK
ncbi:MAG: hypothetical protein M0Q13_13710 [Methanothrix sp.]|nr:hypothetical protein [Methanothrix sp.]